jgi:predicted AAA+ superfamily ATPase
VSRYSGVILDEIQKAPSLVESIKAAVDLDPRKKFVLSGSSQVLLLAKVRETLAGRAAIEDLWPLTIPEIVTNSWDEAVRPSRLLRFMSTGGTDLGIFQGVPAASMSFSRSKVALEALLAWGGMPAVHRPGVSDEEKRLWLSDYQRTYLERDLVDLARLSDLEPFILAQRAAAGLSGMIVNFSELARQAGTAVDTARRFMRYLELSYQVIMLKPWYRNKARRFARSPKLHFVDTGILRSISRRWGPLTGAEFESAMVCEIIKQAENSGLSFDAWHIRTHDGREVDLLLELDGGYIAVEIKSAASASRVDARHLSGLDEMLDKPLLAGFVLSMDGEVKNLSERIIGAHASWLLGPAD